jgi:hypothetical protein
MSEAANTPRTWLYHTEGEPPILLNKFDIICGTFRPKRTDDLKPGLEEWIGRRTQWQLGWIIEEEDGGDYIGQYAALARPASGFPYGWVPLCDLTDIVLVQRGSWSRTKKGAYA